MCQDRPENPRRTPRDFDVEKTLAAAGAGREYNLANEVASRPMTIEEIVAELFKYHPPTERTLPKFAAINQAAKNFAEVVLANCPGGPARVNAVDFIVLARMMANQAIALNGLAISY